TADPRSAERVGQLRLPDGRTLSYATFDAESDAERVGPDDRPWVVVLDGPGSRGLARAAAPAAATLGIRLAAPDRAGFGATSEASDRGIADWPADHAALLDALGTECAGILGQSGGTPYALAAAAALRERVPAVALVGALAPLEEPANMATAGRQLRGGVKLARRAPWLLRLVLRGAARGARKDPERAARKVMKDAPPADVAVLEDPALWALHVRVTAEILGRPAALAGEIGLLARAWGVDLAAVTCPVALWSGECDETHPTAHSRWLAARLGAAPVRVVPGAATFGMLPVYGDALRFAAGGSV
ncbi:MAG TPA: alpha/beta hydrolase, partial [Conexibacter sp.]|nr:alpha/beta hydrolase [Conexibacter sp.]